jgi:hypothetical protein
MSRPRELREPHEVREARELLERTPALLDTWLIGLSPEWLAADEGEGTYDPVDVVAHLIHGEEVDWIPRMEILLEHGEAKPFTPFDREGFHVKYAGATLETLIPRFSTLRRESLERLAEFRLAPADLARTGTHPAFGRVTLAQLLATWVAHDLTHVAQIARVMAKRYGEAVGPWRAYLGVLADRPREQAR